MYVNVCGRAREESTYLLNDGLAWCWFDAMHGGRNPL